MLLQLLAVFSAFWLLFEPLWLVAFGVPRAVDFAESVNISSLKGNEFGMPKAFCDPTSTCYISLLGPNGTYSFSEDSSWSFRALR